MTTISRKDLAMSEVILKREGTVAVLQICRPQALNALTRSIVDELDGRITEILEDGGIRVVLIHSEGNFAAGADIRDMEEMSEAEARAFAFAPTFNRIAALPMPTVAAMEGYALGGGLELALACDIRYAADNARMGFPESNLGIMPGAGGTVRAPRLIGEAAAKELIFTGRILEAQEAMALGLVNRVVPQGDLMKETQKLVDKLASKAPLALTAAKRTIEDALAAPTAEDGIALETGNWAKLFGTRDQREGMRAFLDKRKPAFTGK